MFGAHMEPALWVAWFEDLCTRRSLAQGRLVHDVDSSPHCQASHAEVSGGPPGACPSVRRL